MKRKSIILHVEKVSTGDIWSKSYKYVGAAQTFATILKHEFGREIKVHVFVDGSTYNKSRKKYLLTRLGSVPESIPYISEDFNY